LKYNWICCYNWYFIKTQNFFCIITQNKVNMPELLYVTHISILFCLTLDVTKCTVDHIYRLYKKIPNKRAMARLSKATLQTFHPSLDTSRLASWLQILHVPSRVIYHFPCWVYIKLLWKVGLYQVTNIYVCPLTLHYPKLVKIICVESVKKNNFSQKIKTPNLIHIFTLFYFKE
jgi:hypothetical protein